MARKASSKPADSTANLGFEANAVHVSAFLQCKASPRVVSAAKDKNAYSILANDIMFSNQIAEQSSIRTSWTELLPSLASSSAERRSPPASGLVGKGNPLATVALCPNSNSP
jgi:hypothetical protein